MTPSMEGVTSYGGLPPLSAVPAGISSAQVATPRLLIFISYSIGEEGA